MNEHNTKLMKSIIDELYNLRSREYQGKIVRDIELITCNSNNITKAIRAIENIADKLGIQWDNEYNRTIDWTFVDILKQKNSKLVKSRFEHPMKSLFTMRLNSNYSVYNFQRNDSNTYNKRLDVSQFDKDNGELYYIYINSNDSPELYERVTKEYLKDIPNLFKFYSYWDEGIETRYDISKSEIAESFYELGINDIEYIDVLHNICKHKLNDGLLLLGSLMKQCKYMRVNHICNDNKFVMISPSVHKMYHEILEHIDPNFKKSEVVKLINIISLIYNCNMLVVHKHRKILNQELTDFKDCNIMFINLVRKNN